jgi:hypothetical protein
MLAHTAFNTLISLMASYVFAGDEPSCGKKGTVKQNVLGCYSKEIYDRYFQIILAKDEVAARKFRVQYLMSGDCEVLKEGDEVTVERAAPRAEKLRPFSDNFCVRVTGEVRCLWANKAWVRKK